MPDRRPASWFGQHSGMAVFAVGVVVIAAGILQPDRSAILFLGSCMVLVGALLPRLVGNIRITPASIELRLAERLEATRHAAESRAPGHEAEAIGRAFETLLPQLRAAGVLPTVDPSDPGPSTEPAPGVEADAGDPAGASAVPVDDVDHRPSPAPPPTSQAGAPTSSRRRPSGGRPRWALAAGIAVATLALILVTPTMLVDRAGDGQVDDGRDVVDEDPGVRPPADANGDSGSGGGPAPPAPERPEPRTVTWMAAIAGLVVLTAGGLAASRSRRRAVRRRRDAASQDPVPSPLHEPPPRFAQRIVDDVVDEVRGRTG